MKPRIRSLKNKNVISIAVKNYENEKPKELSFKFFHITLQER
ncbi:MAG: hypothetical protein QW213_06345 [Thermoproteota archaeon]